jgi:hypothetical protein
MIVTTQRRGRPRSFGGRRVPFREATSFTFVCIYNMQPRARPDIGAACGGSNKCADQTVGAILLDAASFNLLFNGGRYEYQNFCESAGKKSR